MAGETGNPHAPVHGHPYPSGKSNVSPARLSPNARTSELLGTGARALAVFGVPSTCGAWYGHAARPSRRHLAAEAHVTDARLSPRCGPGGCIRSVPQAGTALPPRPRGARLTRAGPMRELVCGTAAWVGVVRQGSRACELTAPPSPRGAVAPPPRCSGGRVGKSRDSAPVSRRGRPRPAACPSVHGLSARQGGGRGHPCPGFPPRQARC